MIPVDLNRLREARDVLIEPKTQEMEQALYERTKVVDAVLDAPREWRCRYNNESCFYDSPCVNQLPESRCGQVALVPLKGES